jgi:uncharacterized coiled-coil DUF342 family protein
MLDQQLSALKQKEDQVEAETQKWAEKRDETNAQVRDVRNEIVRLRSQRDMLNEEVKDLKLQRSALKDKIHEEIEEVKKLRQGSKKQAENRPSRSHHALQEEVEKIDWKIQTTSLSLQEERELVEQVRLLETQLNVHRRSERLSQKIRDLHSEIKAFNTRSKTIHEKLTATAEESQQIHQKMIAKIEELKRLRVKADDLHKRFLQERGNSMSIREEMPKISNMMRQLKDEIRAGEEEAKREREGVLREKLEGQAKEKLKRKEKLSWEEFQVLAEKGMGKQD